MTRHTMASINALTTDEAVALLGGVFEHSPWIVAQTWPKAPFSSLTALHASLYATVLLSSEEVQDALIRAHPDLVGQAAKAGTLTRESSAEQRASGLSVDDLTADEIATFNAYNARYQEKFGFPFVICARENRKASILAGFEKRLGNGKASERNTALREIQRIAWFRLCDLIEDDSAAH